MKIGLSLGGGGSKGFAHLGVLQALEEAKVSIDVINGTSVGAVIGAAYALYHDLELISGMAEELFRKIELKYSNVFRGPGGRSPPWHRLLAQLACYLFPLRRAVFSQRINRRILRLLFDEREFADLQIPFTAVAVDLLAGEPVILKEGRLAEALLPAIAIPGIFPPLERDGQLLVDGGALSFVPVPELRREGAEFVIAVELGDEPQLGESPPSGFNLISYLDALKSQELTDLALAEADFTIRIVIPGFDSFRFDNYAVARDRGYAIARELMPQLQKRLSVAQATLAKGDGKGERG